MQRRTPALLNAAGATASHYRVGHTRYVQPTDVGLVGGSRFDAVFAASALKTATFATSAAQAQANQSAIASLPEINDFVNHFTTGNSALHGTTAAASSSSPSGEHTHHGLDAAYAAITRAEEIFTSLIEHQLSEKRSNTSASSANGGDGNQRVSAAKVSDDLKLQFATIAAAKISLLTNNFNHLGSGQSHAAAAIAESDDPAAIRARPAYTTISHPAMAGRNRLSVESEVVLAAVKALALFETPQRIATAAGGSGTADVSVSSGAAVTSSAGGVGSKTAAMFPFMKEEATAGDANAPLPTTARDAPTHSGRSELGDLIASLSADPSAGGFLSGKLTRDVAASAQLLDTVGYLVTSLTFALAKLKEIAPDSPLHFDGSQWSVFGSSNNKASLTRAEKALRDSMALDTPRYFHLVESFRLADASSLLRDTIRTYASVGGSQNAVDAHTPELTFAAASVANVLRSSATQTASRLCVTAGLLRILLDGNLIEAQKEILRGRKLLTMAHNNGREETSANSATAVAGNQALQAQQTNAAAYATLGQQLTACPLPLIIGEFGQSLRYGDDDRIGAGSPLEGGADIGTTNAIGAGNRNYGKLAGNDFSSVRNLHNRVSLFSVLDRNEAKKRPVEGGLFLTLNAELLARKSYGTFGPNQVDGPLVDIYTSAVEYYRTSVEDSAKADSLALTASSVLSAEQKALLREQRAAEQDHYATALMAAGNFFLCGAPRPPPATNKPQDTRIWDSPHVQLAYLQSPIVGARAGSDQLFTESVRGAMGGGNMATDMPFDLALKAAQQHLEKALQMTRSVASSTSSSANGGGVTNDSSDASGASSVYNLKAAHILRSLACVYCEMKDYLYATGLFASAERAFAHHYGPRSAEVLDLLALQETYQRRIGATREGEMTFKKMMGVVNERRKHGLL